MSALKLEELYRMLTLSAVEDEIFMNCWQQTPNPEISTEHINWLSNILMNEQMFQNYSKEIKQNFFEKTLKMYNQISFIDSRGKSLDTQIALFLCLDLVSAIENTEEFIDSKLSSVVVYGGEKLRESEDEGGVLFSRGTQVFIDFLRYSIYRIEYYDEKFSESFENPLKDMLPKVTIANIEEIPKKELSHFKKYIKNGKERLKQIQDKKNHIKKITKWTESLKAKPNLNKATKMQLLSFIGNLNSEISQEEIKHPGSLFLTEDELQNFEDSNEYKGIIRAFSNIPFNGLTTEIINCINTCKHDTEYSIHISLPHYLENISNNNNNVFIHEVAHLIDQELKETLPENSIWTKIHGENILNKNFNLNKYGLTNKVEFFAVCTEGFTQNPDNIKDSLPEVYSRLQSIMNQNPVIRQPISELSNKLLLSAYSK